MRLAPLLPFSLLVSFLGVGCAYALHPSTTGESQRIRLVAEEPKKFAFRVLDGEEQEVKGDGTIEVEMPQFSNCSRYLFGIPKARLYDGTPEKMKVIELRKDGRTLKKLSLDGVAKLPIRSVESRELSP